MDFWINWTNMKNILNLLDAFVFVNIKSRNSD